MTLWWFLLYNNVIQLHLHTSILFHIFSHMGYHRILRRVPWAIQQVSTDYIATPYTRPCRGHPFIAGQWKAQIWQVTCIRPSGSQMMKRNLYWCLTPSIQSNNLPLLPVISSWLCDSGEKDKKKKYFIRLTCLLPARLIFQNLKGRMDSELNSKSSPQD